MEINDVARAFGVSCKVSISTEVLKKKSPLDLRKLMQGEEYNKANRNSIMLDQTKQLLLSQGRQTQMKVTLVAEPSSLNCQPTRYKCIIHSLDHGRYHGSSYDGIKLLLQRNQNMYQLFIIT
jgi:hypothetical protein